MEFALVLPFLLLLILGLIQYGFYFWSMQGGSSAAREAARRGAVGEPATCTSFRTYVRDRIGSAGDAGTATITRTYTTPAGAPRAAADVEVGDLVKVRVEFDSYDMNIPFLPFVDDGQVKQSAEARVEYVRTAPEECA